jgi:hypothetical protein
MKMDDDKHVSEVSRRLNLIHFLALLTTLIILLTFATSLTLARMWKLQQIIETELLDK